MLEKDIQNSRLVEKLLELKKNPSENAKEIEQLEQKQLFESFERFGNALTLDVLDQMAVLEKHLNTPACLKRENIEQITQKNIEIFNGYIKQFINIKLDLINKGLRGSYLD